MINNWFALMDSLKNSHSEIANLIGEARIAFIDIPMYFNVGDLLIYFGTEAFIKEYNLNVIYRTGMNVDLKKLKDVDVILFQGGGNFGDLYPHHQQLREKITLKFPNKKIICLPQTLHFNNEEELERSAKIFKKHSDFHLYVRDQESLTIGYQFTDNIKLIPDMAHSLHPLIDINECDINRESYRILHMVRSDKEANSNNANNMLSKRSFDWANIISPSMYLMGRSIIILDKLRYSNSMKFWDKIASDMVFKSINYFMSHNEVYSDRLHGIILAALLGKKIRCFDNNYKK
ncbi:polysaccharide pyruvyl transferase family protein, partial [Escherichia coli]|nr:polysaccharide pyruvyl transferase family protein [Escherichia coli]